jgi:hypothetical protein
MKPRIVFTFFTMGILLLLPPGFAQQVTPEAGQQVEMKFKASDHTEVPYLLYLPSDFQAEGDKKFPLIFFCMVAAKAMDR